MVDAFEEQWTMASDIPYMMQLGNIQKIFERIGGPGNSPKFTYEFLKNSLRFGGSGDRGIIKVLKALGFLTNDSVPTERYSRFKGPGGARELADGLKEGWGAVFLSDQNAHEKNNAQLTQILQSVTGMSEAVAMKMAGTFRAIAAIADWTVDTPASGVGAASDDRVQPRPELESASAPNVAIPTTNGFGLTLRNDIHLHLPATSDVSVYTAIFRAIRDELRD